MTTKSKTKAPKQAAPAAAQGVIPSKAQADAIADQAVEAAKAAKKAQAKEALANLELDEDDLELELPASKPMTGKAPTAPKTIAEQQAILDDAKAKDAEAQPAKEAKAKKGNTLVKVTGDKGETKTRSGTAAAQYAEAIRLIDELIADGSIDVNKAGLQESRQKYNMADGRELKVYEHSKGVLLKVYGAKATGGYMSGKVLCEVAKAPLVAQALFSIKGHNGAMSTLVGEEVWAKANSKSTK